MATRPELHIAVAKQKSKASEYNDNFDMMLDYIDDSLQESKDYVDGFMPDVTGQSGKFLTNDGTSTSWASIFSGNQTFTGNNTFSGTNSFTGDVTATTQAYGTNDTKVATTAFAKLARNINWASGVSVTAPTSSAKYTAPYDGVYITTVGKNNSTATLYINSTATAYYYHDAADGANYLNFTVPLSKGDIIYWNATMTTDSSKFYRYKA